MLETRISRRFFNSLPIAAVAIAAAPSLAKAQEVLDGAADTLDKKLYLALIQNNAEVETPPTYTEMLPDYVINKLAALGGVSTNQTAVVLDDSYEAHPVVDSLSGATMQTWALIDAVYQELLTQGKISGSITHMLPVETVSISSPDGNFAKTQLGTTNNKVQLGVYFGDDLVERGAAANEASHTALDFYALFTRYPYMFSAVSEGASYVLQSMWHKYRNTTITDPSITVDVAPGEVSHLNEIITSHSYRDYYKHPTSGESEFKTIVSNLRALQSAFPSDMELALMGEHLGTRVAEGIVDRADGTGQVLVLWDYILRQVNPNIQQNEVYKRILELQNDGTLPNTSITFPENDMQVTASIEHEITFNLDNKEHYGVMVFAPVQVNGVFIMPGVSNVETWLVRNGQSSPIENEGAYTIGGTVARAVIIDPDKIGGHFQNGDKLIVKADFTYTGPDGHQVTQRREDISINYNGFDPKASAQRAASEDEQAVLTDADTQWVSQAITEYSLPESDRAILEANIREGKQQSSAAPQRTAEITGSGVNEFVSET